MFSKLENPATGIKLFFCKSTLYFCKNQRNPAQKGSHYIEKRKRMPVFTHFLSRKPCIPKYGFGTFWDDSQKKKRMESGKKRKKKLARKRIAHGQVSYINRTMEAPFAFSKSHSHRQHSLAWLRTERKDSGPSASRHREIAVPGGSDAHFSSCL